MNANDIEFFMREKKPHFLGVFARDRIPIPLGECCFIFNTDSHNLAGKHWIAVLSSKNSAYIFDPLAASPPLMDICKRLSVSVNAIWINEQRFQSFDSDSCGPHCIFFLHRLCAASSDAEAENFLHYKQKQFAF